MKDEWIHSSLIASRLHSSFILPPSSFSLLRSPLHDKFRRSLVAPRLVSLCRLAPRAHWMTSAGRFSFTAAEGMIHGVHRDAAVVRHLSHVTFAAGFADRNVFVLEISDLTDCGVAARMHFAHLARRKP